MRRKYYCKITAVFLTLATLLYGCQSAETPASDAVVEDTAAPASETDDQEELQEEYMGSKGNQLPRLKELSENVVTADKDPAARKVFEELKRINGDELKYVTDDYGYITFLRGSILEGQCGSAEEAKKALDMILPAVTYNNDMKLSQGEFIEDDFGNLFVIFREELDGKINGSNEIKLFFDQDRNMVGLSASVFPNIFESESVIDQAQAIDIVRESVQQSYPDNECYIYEDEVRLDYRLLTDSLTGMEFNCKVFSVLTDNLLSDVSADEAPYLEHYVSLSGIYLGEEPRNAEFAGDSVSNRRMIDKWLNRSVRRDYSTVIDSINGKKQEITVPVAYDDGMYFLEDLDRGILCADYWEFEYNNEIKVISSKTNDDWDQSYVTAYYNYITAYDFYADDGWPGPDGLGAPVILLMDYCNEDHSPIDNLSYLGQFENAHLFAATSRGNDYHKLLDMIAHEYTHSVTTSILGNVIYKNETGAINEGLSDILGELTELVHYEQIGNSISNDRVFLMGGDGSIVTFRDLFDPEAYGQPSAAGGVYYVPPAGVPAKMNDRGGVHVNSSVVSHMVYEMAETADIPFDEMGKIWLTVACMMVPGTGFSELAEIIPMACELSHHAEYKEDISKCVEKTRMAAEDPYAYPADGACKVYFDLPPWINWNRVRLDLIGEGDMMHSSWPSKGTNRVKVNVYPGKYKIRLTEFDENGKAEDAWFYDGSSWGDSTVMDRQTELKADSIYKIRPITPASSQKQD